MDFVLVCTRKVFEAQKLDPKKGDFLQQIENDKEMIKLGLSDQEIEVMDRATYCIFVKTKVRTAAFIYLQEMQERHSKARNIKYHKFKMQEYMSDASMSTEDMNFLFALRTRTLRGIKKGNVSKCSLPPLPNP